jgi:hypothetical protein
MLHGVDPGACGSGESAARSWLDESKRFVLPLADAASARTSDIGSPKGNTTSEAIRSTLRSMQQWISANPCPDRTIRAQLDVVVGRYGFLALFLETDQQALDKDELLAFGDRLDAINSRLLALIADVERGLKGDDADDAHN